MKTFLLVLSFVFMPVFGFAQTYMNICKTDGSVATYNIVDITKITFDLTGVSDNDVSKLNNVFKPFLLMQNYPNPITTSTTIKYELAKQGKVKLKVFNLAGQLVKTLVNDTKNQGTYSVAWNGNNDQNEKVANGAYIYQLTVDNNSVAKKMIFIK